MVKAKRKLPWWLESGTEVCPACGHTYVYETEFRCVACDGPLCAMCVEHRELEVYCVACPSETVSTLEGGGYHHGSESDLER